MYLCRWTRIGSAAFSAAVRTAASSGTTSGRSAKAGSDRRVLKTRLDLPPHPVRVLEAVKLDEAFDPGGVGLLGSRAEVPESEISPHSMQESLLRLRRRQLRLVQSELLTDILTVYRCGPRTPVPKKAESVRIKHRLGQVVSRNSLDRSRRRYCGGSRRIERRGERGSATHEVTKQEGYHRR